MSVRKKIMNVLVAVMLIMAMMVMPICAEEQEAGIFSVQPRFNNVSSAVLTMGFDTNNVVYCALSVDTYAHGSGVSGIMKLFDSSGTCLAVWSVSDYERPVLVENTYQGEYGETYTCTFFGYAYSNNQTPPDELDMSVSGTCVDAD